MKNALIERSGRIAQFSATPFEVAPDLTWVEVPDDTDALDTYEDGAVVRHVLPADHIPPSVARAAGSDNSVAAMRTKFNDLLDTLAAQGIIT